MFGGGDARTPQLLNMILAQQGTFTGLGGPNEPGPVASEMNRTAGENLIDLNR
jgi:hypothetical protein